MKNFWKQFKGHQHGHFVQFIKYGISGGIATLVHICLFYWLAWKIFPALSSNDIIAGLLKLPVPDMSDALRARNSVIDNVIAFMFSNFVVYLINIYWVFERGRHHIAIEIGMFYLVSGLSIVVGSSLMGFLIGYFGFDTTPAFAANVVVSLLINYVIRKFVIFKG